ncbi:MAG TPA: NUDIX domain-containing protein [Longimicrobiaceae bacterium]|nr:NUDIX domain-containing protein [Longimicrobiaceae bacterium]
MTRSDAAASLPRSPTADPGRYLIPADALPPGFAQKLEERAGHPAEPRPASTVVLAREGTDGVEVLLLRRPGRSRFAAGAWVFPGGRVDADDAALDLSSHASGPSAAEWAARLGLDDADEATGFVVAALREAWEETGVLLTRGACPDLRDARRAVLADELAFSVLVEHEGLQLATDELLYIAHWVTPEPEPRRYDTRFFLARVEPGTACELVGDELVEARWTAPAEAVRAAHSGEMHLLPPTLHTLQRLAEHPALRALWEALRGAPVPRILPKMRAVGEGVVIEVTSS